MIKWSIRSGVGALLCCLSFSAASVGTLACSSGGGTGGGAGDGGVDAGLTADQACKSLIDNLCTKSNTCSSFGFAYAYGDAGTCGVRASVNCVPSITLNGTGVTPEKADLCGKAIVAASCADLKARTRITACEFTGTLANGTACGNDGQCINGYCKLNGPICGVCSARQAADAGACTKPEDCVAGTTCVGGGCATYVGAGQNCANAPCTPGLYCKANTCAVAGATVGAACNKNIGESCDFSLGLYCDTGNACAALALAGAGAPCGTIGGVVTLCSGSGICRLGSDGGTVCVFPAADGQACTSDGGVPCLAPAFCDNSVCKLPDPKTCL